MAAFERPCAMRASTACSRTVNPPPDGIGVAGTEHLRDDLWFHHRAAGRDPPYGVDELLAVDHPVLEQIPDRAGAVGEQLTGVQLLDVLRQHQFRQMGRAASGGERGPPYLVGDGRRQPDIDDRDVGPIPAESLLQ
ncbi:hypothetical protein [Actinoplanes awajinensis]|uniref:Uncharacterized protein n=1 Tax=Actinoplanes awajinensis subsp. mycoplanecinus TaxID=135947 RepID=A0A101J9Q6_9ACTN|nr:hypothetical protein ADL15_47440 [Actinoplanes awajinensis subsp. mycoplanecinus]